MKLYSVKDAAEMLGVHSSTLRRWEIEGKLVPQRTKGGHRRYSISQLSEVKQVVPIDEKIVVGYCRVSSSDQKKDLETQIDTVSKYCVAKGYQFKIVKDLGSGLNYNKKGLRELINLIQSNKVETIVINYKDRLIRFGYELIEQMCIFHNVKIEVINHTEEKTYEQELVEDVLAIITVFSARLYGKRSHKQAKVVNKIKQLIHEEGGDKDDI